MGPGSVNAYERSRKEMAQIVARRSPMRMLICTIVLLVAVSACVEAPAPPPAPNMPSGKSDGPPQAASPPATPIDVDGGLARLRTALSSARLGCWRVSNASPLCGYALRGTPSTFILRRQASEGAEV
jgi:hypothetical protein